LFGLFCLEEFFLSLDHPEMPYPQNDHKKSDKNALENQVSFGRNGRIGHDRALLLTSMDHILRGEKFLEFK
jgi:hypothetical protein